MTTRSYVESDSFVPANGSSTGSHDRTFGECTFHTDEFHLRAAPVSPENAVDATIAANESIRREDHRSSIRISQACREMREIHRN